MSQIEDYVSFNCIYRFGFNNISLHSTHIVKVDSNILFVKSYVFHFVRWLLYKTYLILKKYFLFVTKKSNPDHHYTKQTKNLLKYNCNS